MTCILYKPHSNRACMYYSHPQYMQALADNRIKITLTQFSYSMGNAIAERMNVILNTEWIDLESYHTHEKASHRISETIDFYNT